MAESAAPPLDVLPELLEGVDGGVLVFDSAGRLTCWNRAAGRLLDLPEDWLRPGRTLEDLGRLVAERGDTGWAGRRRDGERFPVRCRERWLEAVFGAQGRVLNIRPADPAGANALRELRATEADAARARGWLREVLESIGDGIAVFDADDRLLLCNHQFRSYFPWIPTPLPPGYGFEDIVARAPAELTGIWRRRHRRVGAPFELNPVTGIWTLVDERPTLDGHVVSVHTDITGLKLRELRLSGILDTVADGVITIDADGRITTFNAAAERIFGWPADQVVGREVTLLMPETEARRHQEYLDRFIASGEPRLIGRPPRELTGRRADGSLFAMELSVSALRFGGRWLFTGVVRDITDRQRAHAELVQAKHAAEAASRTKSAFLAMMGHELRTPLNAIIGFSDIMQRELLGELGNNQYRSYVGDIHRSGQNLLSVIDDILDLSRLATGEVTITETDVDLCGLVDDAWRDLEDLARARDVVLDRGLPSEGVRVRGDAQRLAKLIHNLLSNAIKFNVKGGQVRVTGGIDAQGGPCLTITDTGIGMTPADLHLARQSFRQVDGRLARRYQGAGLGLPLADRLARLHGGSLEIVSEAGVGTRATLCLPACRRCPPA